MCLKEMIYFGRCADRVKDSATSDEDTVEEEELTDGLLGLGPHQPAGWLQQLFYLGLISEFRFAICLEPRLGDIDIPLPDPSLVNYAGFLAFGELFATQAANTVWTRIIPPKSDIAKYVLFLQTHVFIWQDALRPLEHSWYAIQKLWCYLKCENEYFFITVHASYAQGK